MKYVTLHKYVHDTKVDIAKNRFFPKLRGTLIPSFDWQVGEYSLRSGIAVNWLWIRLKIKWAN